MDEKVVILIAIVQGFYLLVFSPEGWLFPGGKVKEDETLEQALRRELGEEVPGLQIKKLRYWRKFGRTTQSQKKIMLYAFFAAEVSGSILPGENQPGENIAGAVWVKDPYTLPLTEDCKLTLQALSGERVRRPVS